MPAIKVGDTFPIKPFTGWPWYGRVRVLDPGGTTVTSEEGTHYLVEVVGDPRNRWWMSPTGRPNNHRSPHVRVGRVSS